MVAAVEVVRSDWILGTKEHEFMKNHGKNITTTTK